MRVETNPYMHYMCITIFGLANSTDSLALATPRLNIVESTSYWCIGMGRYLATHKARFSCRNPMSKDNL